jgi:hydroxypyruvate isomerase
VEEAAKVVLATLEDRDVAFREQVERARAYRETLRAAGVDVRQKGFSVPLMQRLETAASPVLTSIRL